MMGSKGSTNASEYDAFSRRSRRLISSGCGGLKKIKRAFWKRERKAFGKAELDR
ncbi:hypothetical protein G6K88_15730 [Agrobacterium rhizogenes]|uniref:hypothetical protein n=1 Tax=Rhizobium rhizogenes TaxID=359 RepID=UPI0015729897|nr:hypothetical protein [Rhizobium rhizogenes]NTI03473.1 hypothetical protein [Rhizobium rhizogenes]NTI10278.1 hypothetical protein [Rhizobium rhizogenes]